MKMRNKWYNSTQAVKAELLSDRSVQKITGSHIISDEKVNIGAKHPSLIIGSSFNAYELITWILRPNLPATTGVRSDSIARVRPA
jgi:hypothetical protein